MSSTALKATFSNSNVLDGSSDGSVTYNFGLPISGTAAEPSPIPMPDGESRNTQESEVRKTIQVNQAGEIPQTTTRNLTADEYFKPIKNWEGVVETVSEDSFLATMRDTENFEDHGDEQFEIDIADVETGDRELVAPGSIFYFTVGYRIRRGGTRIKGAQIVFRRMPRWSKNDIERNKQRAQRLLNIILGENGLEHSA